MQTLAALLPPGVRTMQTNRACPLCGRPFDVTDLDGDTGWFKCPKCQLRVSGHTSPSAPRVGPSTPTHVNSENECSTATDEPRLATPSAARAFSRPPGAIPTTDEQSAPSAASSPGSVAPATPPIGGRKAGPANRLHPAVWALLGGGVVAVLVLIGSFIINRTGKTEEGKPPAANSSAGDLPPHSTKPTSTKGRRPKAGTPGSSRKEADDPLGDFLAADTEDSRPTKSKPPLSPEDLYAAVSPGVVTVAIKNDDGKTIASGSGFLLQD